MAGVLRHIMPLAIVLALSPLQLSASDISEIKYAPGNLNAIKFTNDMWEDTFLFLEQLKPAYIDENHQFDLPAPPLNDSEATAEELHMLFTYEKELRSPEVIEKIKRDQFGPVREVFGNGAEVPFHIMKEVENVKQEAIRDMDGFLYKTKRKYRRARPTQIAPELTTVIKVPGGPAYPSGHAATTQLATRVYSYIDPVNEAAYQDFSTDLSKRRAIAGIHYESDCKAGRDLADQVFELLLQSEAFKTKLDAAKTLYDAHQVEVGNLNAIQFRPENWSPKMRVLAERLPGFLDKDADIEVEPPTANDSAETQAEIKVLREYVAKGMTPETVQQIKYEAEHGGRFDIEIHGLEALSEDFKKDLVDFEALAIRDITYFLFKEKLRHARARPQQIAPDLEVSVKTPGHASYPSGHAAQSFLVAKVLGYVDPARKNEYEQAAKNIGHRRELAKIHYASDSKAGRELANRTFERLLEVPAFKEKLQKIAEAYQVQVN